ncbi:MAG TPA: serine/threonine-protein kinase, partial [Thermoanaerobaculia bacterium]
MLPLTPTKLGRYEIVDEIGKGAMGVVFLARDPLIGRLVALKTFRIGYSIKDQEMEQFRIRFMREAQSAGILTHPHIVTIHDVVEQSEEGLAFIAMEYVRGTNLKLLLQGDRPMTLAVALDIVSQVGDALDYAHANRVIHRDVKPANILIDEDDRAYLADFGIAKALEGNDNLTQAGVGIGTPEYMAPEQAQGRADPRSDLYALGVMVYQMLTGQVPFSGNTTVEVLMKHLQEPVPLSPLRGAVAQQFGPILQRALAKDPNLRYQSGREMMADVNQAMTRSGFASIVVTNPTVISAVPPPSSNPSVTAPAAQTPPPATYTPPPGGYTPPPGGYTP